jgi:hypothetical protein
MAGVKGSKDARYDLIPPEATWFEALVYGQGAEKYAERNWEMGYEWGKTIAALERHLQLFKAGEDNDPESGLPHMAHARWHTGVILTFAARGLGIDDRPENVALMAMQATVLNQDEILAAGPKKKQDKINDNYERLAETPYSERFERVK